jgi:DNA primase
LFPQQFIDDLRLQANLVQVVQEYVPLKRVGGKYKGLCPFHAEKTPSFHVDPDRGFFHCFGCGAGGDVFKFVELQEKVGFPDAVRFLAQKFGVALPEHGDAADEELRRDAAGREALLKMHEIAAAYFREALAGRSGGRARQSLAERGVTSQTADQLGLGYAVSSRDGLKSRLASAGFAEHLLLQSGLVVRRENGDIVDRFRHRLMVPISRDTGSVVAFGGRAMDPEQVPKYLNSPETPIYSKGRMLYGLNFTKAAIRKLGYAVLVEGYFDFAQVYQSGAAPVVALCGTALTSPQAQLLHRFTNKIVLSLDPDAAGQGAAARSCELLVSEGFDVNVVTLDGGGDPDTFIRRNGPEQYRERLRGSRPYLEYLLDRAATGVDFGHDESRRQFLNGMLGVAARIPDAALRDQFADRIAHKARITEEVVRNEIRKAAGGRKTTVTARELPSFGTLKPAERALIWGLFHRTTEAVAALGELDPADLDELAGREVFEVARSLQNQQPDGIPSELLRRLSTMNAQLVTGIAGNDMAPVAGPGDLLDCARILKRLRCERERAAIQREIDRLQGQGPLEYGDRLNLLLNQKRTLAQRIEQLTWLTRED